MPADKELFGFDELEKAFRKIESKYPSKADALLMAQGRVATDKTKKGTPVGKTKKLKSSWRLKNVKEYGKTKVVRIQSTAPHAHLVEDGHKIVSGGRARGLNIVQRAVRGIKVGGKTEGKKMLDTAMKEVQKGFTKSAEKMLEDLTNEVEL